MSHRTGWESFRLPFLCAATLATACVVLALFGNILCGSGEEGAGRSKPADDPVARADWELTRLRSPATGRIPDDIRARERDYAAMLPVRGESPSFMKGSAALALDWKSIGPYAVGGRTRALALDITGEDTILAGGASGGMWRSSDAGRSWRRTTGADQLPSVTCVAQDPRPGKSSIWYHGTGEVIGNSAAGQSGGYIGDGIFKSTDNGRSWSHLTSTGSEKPHRYDAVTDYIWNIVVDPSRHDSDIVYAAVFGGILRSADGGENWTMVLHNDPSVSQLNDIVVTRSGVLYAALCGFGGESGVWRSEEGIEWTRITPAQGWPQLCPRMMLAVAPSNENVVYALGHTPGSGKRGKNWNGDDIWGSIWRYSYVSGSGAGAGGRWEDRSAAVPAFGSSFGDFDPQSSYDMCIAVKPDDENVVFIGGTNVYRSVDGFSTAGANAWVGGYRDVTYELPDPIDKLYLYPNHHPDIHRIVFSQRDPSVVYTAGDGGVHVSDDALAEEVAWRSLNNGYLTTQFYTVAVDQSTPGNFMVIGGLQDQSTWLSDGDPIDPEWHMVGGDYDGSYCAIVDGGRSVYLSVQFGWTYRAAVQPNGGVADYARIDPTGGTGYLFVNPFAPDPSDEKIVYMIERDVIWRNSDATALPAVGNVTTALNWTRMQKSSRGANARIQAFGVSTSSPSHRIYYGTQGGKVLRIDGAKSGDPVPVDISSPLFPKGSYISCIAVDPANGDRAVVAFSNYEVVSLFATTDAGKSWQAVSGNLEENPDGTGAGPSCRWVEIVNRGSSAIYLVGTSVGLFSTTSLNGNATVWEREGSSTIGNVVVDMIDARSSDGFIAVATHGNGVYTAMLPTLGTGESVASAAMTLEGNAPNPASSGTTIRFTLARPDHARLELFDATGRAVSTLHDGRLGAGRHEVRVDLSSPGLRGIPDGAYYYRLKVGTDARSGKMIVARR